MKRTLSIVVVALVAAGAAAAGDINLTAILYPDNTTVTVPFTLTAAAPKAKVEADVRSRDGQSRIEISYKGMQPALLFGGDVSAFVVWAITRDGIAENLGELIVRDPNDSGTFSTGQKSFAMMITAEPYPFVEKPSDLVIFTSGPAKNGRSSAFAFSGAVPGLRHGLDTIAGIAWTEKTPIDLAVANKIYKMAEAMKAGDVNPQAMKDARVALTQATNLTRAGGSSRAVSDYARRAAALASEAIRDTNRKAAEAAAAAAAARKKAELDALAQKATDAEAARQQTVQALSQTEAARRQAEAAQKQTAAVLAETEAARQQADQARQQAEASIAQAKADMAQLAAEREKLQAERDALAKRLSSALSKVAETQDSARGVILSLSSGILFDVNKSALKPAAEVALAKLAGIMLMIPDMNLRIEGYTDSSGKDETNIRLSKDRALSVFSFLKDQGLGEARMKYEGYGPANPVAPNDTQQGRAKNRRVDIIVAQGEIKPAS
jgi:outer membrane protein OmpA-like peptidoglycan-associated protein